MRLCHQHAGPQRWIGQPSESHLALAPKADPVPRPAAGGPEMTRSSSSAASRPEMTRSSSSAAGRPEMTRSSSSVAGRPEMTRSSSSAASGVTRLNRTEPPNQEQHIVV